MFSRASNTSKASLATPQYQRYAGTAFGILIGCVGHARSLSGNAYLMEIQHYVGDGSTSGYLSGLIYHFNNTKDPRLTIQIPTEERGPMIAQVQGNVCALQKFVSPFG